MNYFNFSETSNEPLYNNNQKGGFLFSTNYSNLLFELIKDNQFEFLLYLINKPSIISTINYTTDDNKTLLHLLVLKFKQTNNNTILDIINSVVKHPDIVKLINVQDSEGNTPLHLAVMNNLNNICDILINNGANKLIKNIQGLYIDSVNSDSVNNITNSISNIKNNTSNQINKINNILNSDINTNKEDSVFISRKTLKDGFNKFYNNNANKPETSNNNNQQTSVATGMTQTNENTVIKQDNNTDNVNMTMTMNNTSDFVNNLVNKYSNKQFGGVKKSRKLNINSDFAISEVSLELPNLSATKPNKKSIELSNISDEFIEKYDDMSELSRMINNQATQIHERTVKKISELLNISEKEARIYKAYIYSEIKKLHPELNNFDRAVEMEKQITTDFLNSIDKKKISDLEIAITSASNNITEKSENKEDKKEEKSKSKKQDKDIKKKDETKEKKTKKSSKK